MYLENIFFFEKLITALRFDVLLYFAFLKCLHEPLYPVHISHMCLVCVCVVVCYHSMHNAYSRHRPASSSLNYLHVVVIEE